MASRLIGHFFVFPYSMMSAARTCRVDTLQMHWGGVVIYTASARAVLRSTAGRVPVVLQAAAARRPPHTALVPIKRYVHSRLAGGVEDLCVRPLSICRLSGGSIDPADWHRWSAHCGRQKRVILLEEMPHGA